MENDNYVPPRSVRAGRFRAIRIVLVVVVVLGGLFAANGVFARVTANVSPHEARQIAEDFVGGGTAVTPDWEWDWWRWLWSVEVLVFEDGLVHEIYIHPNSGEIVRHEIDIWWD